ncbi:hypothetical protein O2K51_05780 [Apibacter raozihei]|uniref:hypothetical protein n=1 Tax=Apibacter raozihei TaxID=2500547 RepID=UPI000FE3F8B3|nr:hypothetical protein [Apibacter raozihei]
MSFFLNNKITSSIAFVHIYKCSSASDLENTIDLALRGEKYKKVDSAKGLVYVKGDRVLRLLFGAFVKYFKFKVLIKPEGENTYSVAVSSVSSGFSGGVIGVSQIRTETQKLEKLFQNI